MVYIYYLQVCNCGDLINPNNDVMFFFILPFFFTINLEKSRNVTTVSICNLHNIQ